MTLFENWVTAQVQAGASIRGLYPPNTETRARYQVWSEGADGKVAAKTLLEAGKGA